MATRDEVEALLAVACPWCGAAVGEFCSASGPRKSREQVGPRRTDRRPIRTLDGGCHDARWHKALGVDAQVLTEVVRSEHVREEVPVHVDREPQLVGAPVERPW